MSSVCQSFSSIVRSSLYGLEKVLMIAERGALENGTYEKGGRGLPPFDFAGELE
jgi:hypothetical protein